MRSNNYFFRVRLKKNFIILCYFIFFFTSVPLRYPNSEGYKIDGDNNNYDNGCNGDEDNNNSGNDIDKKYIYNMAVGMIVTVKIMIVIMLMR